MADKPFNMATSCISQTASFASCKKPKTPSRASSAPNLSERGPMDLTFEPQEETFRQEARSWLEANVPKTPLASGDTKEGFAQHVEWEKKLFEAGWAVVSWPKEYGGRGATLMEWLIFEEEYYRAGAPSRVTQNGIFLMAPTLFEYGTEIQKERYLKKMASADELWAQGWSEPNAGSDATNLQTRAVKEGNEWVLNGAKTFITNR